MKALVLAATLLWAAIGPAVSLSAAAKPTLWYGGDSISDAFMCPGCTVAERLFARQAGFRVLPSSVGLDGRTFGQFSRETSYIPEASVAVVELGTNDFLQNLALEDVRASAAELLDRVRAGQLFCLGVSAPADWLNARGLRRADYDALIADECRQHGGTFVAIGDKLEARIGAVLADGVHISQQGHGVISRLLYARLLALSIHS